MACTDFVFVISTFLGHKPLVKQDPEYQAKMKKTTDKTNTTSARQKISQTLKEKWQDPDFRMKMMNAMKNRKSPNAENSTAQRAKISAAMKRKWQDMNYRRKAILGMERYREKFPPRPTKVGIVKRMKPTKAIVAAVPITGGTHIRKNTITNDKVEGAIGKVKTVKKKTVKKKKVSRAVKVGPEIVPDSNVPSSMKKEASLDFDKDGDISRMKHERRDLYDLLYGDEFDDVTNDDENSDRSVDNYDEFSDASTDRDYFKEDINNISVNGVDVGLTPFFSSTVHLDDDDLDDFDPYNLDDY
jgi:hypothetical protein